MNNPEHQSGHSPKQRRSSLGAIRIWLMLIQTVAILVRAWRDF